MEETNHRSAGAASGLRALWPSCREVSRLQSSATQQPLSLGRRLGLKFHLLVCSWCRRYGKHLVFLRAATHERPRGDDAITLAGLSSDARERMKRSLQDK